MKLRKIVGKRLRLLRLERDWTLAEAAKRSKLSEQYISRVEKRLDINLTLDNLEKLAAGYGVRVAEIVETEAIEVPNRDRRVIAQAIDQCVAMLARLRTIVE